MNTCSCPTTQNTTSCSGGRTGTETVTTDCQGNIVSTDTSSCTCPTGTWNGTQCVTTGGGSGSGSAGSCSLSATPSSWTGSTYALISWSGSNLKDNSCSASWTTMTQTSGTSEVYASQTTTYQMSCQDTGGKAVDCSPTTVTIQQAPAQTTSDISVTTNLGGSIWNFWPGNTNYIGNQNLTVTPSDTGILYSVTPSSETGYDWSVSNSKGGGSSMLVFPGESDSFAITYTATLPPAPTFDYSLSNSGNTTVMKGGIDTYGQNTVTKSLVSGSSQSVSLTLSGVPANVDYAVANSTCSPSCASTITFTVHSGAAAGTYPITVSGSSPAHTTSFSLVIENSPSVSVSCAPSPTPALVGQSVTWTGSVSGGVPPYTYSWSGTNVPTPAPTTNPFSMTYSTVGAKSASLLVTDSIGNTGSCTPAGTVQVNFNPTFKEF